MRAQQFARCTWDTGCGAQLRAGASHAQGWRMGPLLHVPFEAGRPRPSRRFMDSSSEGGRQAHACRVALRLPLGRLSFQHCVAQQLFVWPSLPLAAHERGLAVGWVRRRWHMGRVIADACKPRAGRWCGTAIASSNN